MATGSLLSSCGLQNVNFTKKIQLFGKVDSKQVKETELKKMSAEEIERMKLEMKLQREKEREERKRERDVEKELKKKERDKVRNYDCHSVIFICNHLMASTIRD